MRKRVTVVCLSVSRGTFFSMRGGKEKKRGEKKKIGGGRRKGRRNGRRKGKGGEI